jgi:hypothetical protein
MSSTTYSDFVGGAGAVGYIPGINSNNWFTNGIG